MSGQPVVQQKACSDSIIFQTVPHWIIVLETRQMSAILYWCSFRMSCSNDYEKKNLATPVFIVYVSTIKCPTMFQYSTETDKV